MGRPSAFIHSINSSSWHLSQASLSDKHQHVRAAPPLPPLWSAKSLGGERGGHGEPPLHAGLQFLRYYSTSSVLEQFAPDFESFVTMQ